MTDLESSITNILIALREDPAREGLINTPKRVAESLTYLTKGYHENLDAILNDAIFDSPNTDMVMLRDIEFYSLCEHHLLPFFGACNIAYFPKGKVIGVSKLARIVDMFAMRLQIQETLTLNIAEALQSTLGTPDIAVTIQAKHMCMMMRGVSKQSATMSTSSFLGTFQEHEHIRREFMLRASIDQLS
ncbi:MAG: GTP cyclohydrolase I FolE [Alphaproteobacteria bacterium]|nr:GTP cyclohydrolase I FolE [Alphaproteobacteria bacterium]